MRRGKVRGTNADTGTRYLSLYNAVGVISSEIPLGDFVLRVFIVTTTVQSEKTVDDSVFDGTKKKNTTTLPTTHKDNELSRPTPAAASTVEPVNQRTPPRDIFMGAFAYADDVALLVPTIMSLNKLIDVCVSFAREYHVLFKPIKS